MPSSRIQIVPEFKNVRLGIEMPYNVVEGPFDAAAHILPIKFALAVDFNAKLPWTLDQEIKISCCAA
jgi:hypothetical protein